VVFKKGFGTRAAAAIAAKKMTLKIFIAFD
jgi:hypothetical protein